MTDLASIAKVIAEPVARELLGDPVPGQSKPGAELRWGSGGSMSLDLKNGLWFDHEAGKGGGVLDLIMRETGCEKGDAWDWLKKRGYVADEPREDRPPPARRESASGKPARELVATYDYTDAAGNLLYQVCRFRVVETGKKTFAQRRPDGRGGWIWNLDGIAHGLYRLPALLNAVADDALCVIVEGEKDVDTLTRWGVPATTNSGGAKHWSPDHAAHFNGADVVIIPDNDDAGREGAQIKAKALHGVARCVRILDLAKEVSALEHKGDVTDWAERHGGTADALYEMAARAPVWSPEGEPRRSNLGLVFGRDIETGIKTHSYLVDDLITEAEVVVVAGDSGVGKTFVVSDMAWAVARGVPFLDRFEVQRGGVVYQTGEGATGFRSKRIPAYRQRYGIPADHGLPFAVMPTRVNLWLDDADTGKIIEDLKVAADVFGQPVKMFVVDTLTLAMAGGDENHSGDVAKILGRCNTIRDATGATVVLVAHTPAGGGKIRGSTAWRGNVDSVLMCEHRLDEKGKAVDPKQRDSEGRAIKDVRVVKVKDGPCGWSFPYVLDIEVIGKRPNGKDDSSCIVVPPNGGTPRERADARKPLPPDAMLYLKAIRAAVDDHGRAAPSGVPVAPFVKVVAKEHVRAAHAALWQGEEDAGAPDAEEAANRRGAALRQSRKRNGTTLLNRGLIGSHDPWLWLTPRGEAFVTGEREGVTSGAGAVTPGDSGVTEELDDLPDFAKD